MLHDDTRRTGEPLTPAPLTEADLNGPVTRHMRRDFARLRSDLSVAEALNSLRRDPPPGRIIYLYAVDADGRLEGVVPTRRLLLAPPEQRVADIMVPQVVSLPDQSTVLDACEFFIQYRFLAFPVIDADRRVLGVVDIELYTDELVPLSDAGKLDDLFQLIGVHVAGMQRSSPLAAFRRRFPWLGCNLAGGLIAAFLCGAFESTLSRVVALASFLPVVLNLAESVSSQSVSLTLHLMSGQRPTLRSLLPKVYNELAVGLLLGVACGLVVGGVALVWLRSPAVALALLGGIGGGVALSAVLGLTLPILLRVLRLDPRVAAGPVALAGADVLTILLYLILAYLLIG
jgi:magnesium transporter